MTETEQPQIYLITPPEIELSSFPARLGAVLDAHAVSCVRLSMASQDEAVIARAADALREVAHARDVALVIDEHVMLSERLGLDGVHLLDGSRSVRSTRKTLGSDAIIGAFCGASRHDGLIAGESGADYVAFGPAGDTPLGDGSKAEVELFEWWSEVVELPVVAQGALSVETIRALAPYTDFFGIGDEIWRAEDAALELTVLRTAMS